MRQLTTTEPVTYHASTHMEFTILPGTRCTAVGMLRTRAAGDRGLCVSVEVAPGDLDAWTHREDGVHNLSLPVSAVDAAADELLAALAAGEMDSRTG